MDEGRDNDATLVRARILIAGRVQGVGFRAYAREVASMHGLCGWVRNRPQATVEAVVEGQEAVVQAFVAWCHHGPPAARVTDVQVHWEPYTGELEPFHIRG